MDDHSFKHDYVNMERENAAIIDDNDFSAIAYRAGENIKSLVEQFVSTIERHLAEVQESINTQDIGKLEFASHDLKSLSRQFGALRLSCIARDIEDLTKNMKRGGSATFDDIQEHFGYMEETSQDTFSAIKERNA